MTLEPKRAFHKAYLKQQGMEVNLDNVKDYSVRDDDITLLGEVKDYYILVVSDQDQHAGTFLNAVKKNGAELKTLDL